MMNKTVFSCMTTAVCKCACVCRDTNYDHSLYLIKSSWQNSRGEEKVIAFIKEGNFKCGHKRSEVIVISC